MPIHVASETDALADHAADLIVRLLSERDSPRVNLGLAGGSTPQATYRRLRATGCSWERTDLWLSDERWVPPDHIDSNGRLALDSLGTEAAARLHRPRWSPHLNAVDSAAFYEATLRRLIPEGMPDVIVLGMGDDGHTASLFPGTDALEETDRWFVGNEVPKLDTWRLTATPSFLRRARHLVIIVSGSDKAGVLRHVLEGPDGQYPIQLMRSGIGTVWWLVDRAAASQLGTAEFEIV